MLILILINVEYLQNVVFSFEKGLNSQNHPSDFHQPIKKFTPAEFPIPPPLEGFFPTP